MIITYLPLISCHTSFLNHMEVRQRPYTLLLLKTFVFQRILALLIFFGYIVVGVRGIHWCVCDARARRLNNIQRAAIADYFHVYKGKENNRKKVFLGVHVLHPSLVRSDQQVLSLFFEEKLLCGALNHHQTKITTSPR